MNDLITLNEGTPLLHPLVSAQIAEFERKAKEIKEAEDALKAQIIAEMESKNILSLETEELKISYVASTERESLDSKQLRAEQPDIYDAYIRITPVKASVRIKLKEK